MITYNKMNNKTCFIALLSRVDLTIICEEKAPTRYLEVKMSLLSLVVTKFSWRNGS